jgi:hypothetical protein
VPLGVQPVERRPDDEIDREERRKLVEADRETRRPASPQQRERQPATQVFRESRGQARRWRIRRRRGGNRFRAAVQLISPAGRAAA